MRLTSRPVIGLLLAAGAALVASFDLAPAALLDATFRDKAVLNDAVARGLVEYFRDGGPEFPALLARLVDYWFRWHAMKVVITSLMVVVFVLLAAALWQRYLSGAARHAVGAIGATSLAVVATGVLILNVQATAVPLVALVPLADASGEVPQTLRADPHASSPALPVLLGQVERYYWVMVAVAGPVLVAAGVASWSLWRRRGAGSVRAGSMRKALAVILALTAGLLLVVVAASAYSALHPADSLLGVLGVA